MSRLSVINFRTFAYAIKPQGSKPFIMQCLGYSNVTLKRDFSSSHHPAAPKSQGISRFKFPITMGLGAGTSKHVQMNRIKGDVPLLFCIIPRGDVPLPILHMYQMPPSQSLN
jgi:hypothetical protein